MKIKLSFLFIILLSNALLFGQNKWDGLTVEAMLHYGRAFKHTPKLNYDVNHNSFGQELNFQYQTLGKKEWQAHQRYPLLGISLMHFDLGNKRDLGQAYAIIPNISIPFLRREKTNMEFRVGTGIGYLTEKFSPINNTNNNAIGSNINSAIAFKLGLNYWFRPNIHLTAAGSFTHFSNGAAALPNFGINIPGIVLGVRYFPNAIAPTDLLSTETTRKLDQKKFGANIFLGLAYREYISSQGPRYPIYLMSVAGTYTLTKHNTLSAGIDVEYNKAVYEFAVHTFAFDRATSRKKAYRAMFFVADEFRFGDLGLGLQLGGYVTPNSYLLPFPITTKLSVRYYFKPIGKPATRFYLGTYMKSHLIVAEHIGFGAGAAF